jgi:hypothetical protein
LKFFNRRKVMSVQPPGGPVGLPAGGEPQQPDIQQLANQMQEGIQTFVDCLSASHDNREGLAQLSDAVNQLGQLAQNATQVQ